jgi:hypothetical protein
MANNALIPAQSEMRCSLAAVINATNYIMIGYKRFWLSPGAMKLTTARRLEKRYKTYSQRFPGFSSIFYRYLFR